MNIFKKRETLLQNMTYMAIMAAINLIFILLSNFIPFLLFILLFLLPLASSIVTIYCKKRYFPIYFVVTILLCIFINPVDTLFYVMPSLITGFLFGLMFENRVSPIITIFVTTVVQTILSFLLVWIYKMITNIDVVESIVKVFNLTDYKYVNYVKYVIFFVIALAQEVITFIVLNSQINKFIKEEYKNETLSELLVTGLLLLFVCLTVLFALVLPELSYLAFVCSLYFAVYKIGLIFASKSRWQNFALLGSAIFTFFFFGAMYKVIPAPLSLLSLTLLPLLVGIIVIINNCLVKHRNKI